MKDNDRKNYSDFYMERYHLKRDVKISIIEILSKKCPKLCKCITSKDTEVSPYYIDIFRLVKILNTDIKVKDIDFFGPELEQLKTIENVVKTLSEEQLEAKLNLYLL